jgi:hypothetical protein
VDGIDFSILLDRFHYPMIVNKRLPICVPGWCGPCTMRLYVFMCLSDDESLGRCVPSGRDYPSLSCFLLCSKCPRFSGTFFQFFPLNRCSCHVVRRTFGVGPEEPRHALATAAAPHHQN